MRLQFLGLNALQIVRQDVPSGTTLIGTAQFESGAQYYLTPGLPDTPDGFGRTDDIARARAAGFYSHLTKPLNLQVLTDVMRQLHEVRTTV